MCPMQLLCCNTLNFGNCAMKCSGKMIYTGAVFVIPSDQLIVGPIKLNFEVV